MTDSPNKVQVQVVWYWLFVFETRILFTYLLVLTRNNQPSSKLRILYNQIILRIITYGSMHLNNEHANMQTPKWIIEEISFCYIQQLSPKSQTIFCPSIKWDISSWLFCEDAQGWSCQSSWSSMMFFSSCSLEEWIRSRPERDFPALR